MRASVLKELREHWFVTTLCAATALFFVGSLTYSASTYVNVMEAGQNIVLEYAFESATVLTNGSLSITFSIELTNPSDVDLMVSSVSWSVKLDISQFSDSQYLPLGSSYSGYVGPTEAVVARAGTTTTFSYTSVVSDTEKLSTIEVYIEYWASQGVTYTLGTANYTHDFRVAGWLDDFKHDYQYLGEFYLNDMVRIQRFYYGGLYW